MPVKIFVGRLTEGTHKDDLLELFSKYGEVVECDVLSNFGFVHMATSEEADAAIAALDGHTLKGNNIHVELSTAKTQGRKKRIDGSNSRPYRGMGRAGGSNRFEPYKQHYQDYNGPHRMPSYGDSYPPPRDEYASEQVKDLLELYIRDPVAFDQYAKTYYYGERMERMNREGGGQSKSDYYQPVRRF